MLPNHLKFPAVNDSFGTTVLNTILIQSNTCIQFFFFDELRNSIGMKEMMIIFLEESSTPFHIFILNISNTSKKKKNYYWSERGNSSYIWVEFDYNMFGLVEFERK